MTPTITAFAQSPDRGRGLARDTRVRWALEEVGQPYEVRLLSFGEMKESAHLKLNPFGQIPTYEDGNLALFESGAIVFHIERGMAALVERNMSGSGLLENYSNLSAYVARAEARPAYKRAFDAQLAVFTGI